VAMLVTVTFKTPLIQKKMIQAMETCEGSNSRYLWPHEMKLEFQNYAIIMPTAKQLYKI
jgi:hypothetical protein